MGQPDRKKFDAAAGTNPLHILHHEVRRGGTLETRLKTSLVQAQIEAAAQEDNNIFAFRHGDSIHQDATTRAFRQKLANRRKTAPVVLFDIPAVEQEKGSPAELNDLIRGYEVATLNIAEQQPDEAGNYPLITVDRYLTVVETEELGGGFMRYGGFDSDLRSNPLTLAVIYPETYQIETQRLLFDMVNAAGRRLDILVDQEIVDQATRDYQSPWITKLRFGQLLDLNTGRVEALLDKAGELFDPTRTDRVRYFEADYGAGKTTMLQVLRDADITGVTYWFDAQPLAEQHDLLSGKVIFVDEAIGRESDELKAIVAAAERNDGVVVMCVQNANFRQEVETKLAA